MILQQEIHQGLKPRFKAKQRLFKPFALLLVEGCCAESWAVHLASKMGNEKRIPDQRLGACLARAYSKKISRLEVPMLKISQDFCGLPLKHWASARRFAIVH
jgi:hypothetical protein